ncbi:BON domain-containing protein [uncultured Piscinibacter sp.]|uniref:BON domain-containing protein n=1 Tax=uncultured Piscinibacter sp. TaxID=1131835 RepID=UPI002619B99B|nr:BON domain-containing protein [uncultured Piscinibacter sp.]
MAGTLGACNRRDDSQTTGQKVDAAVAKADAKLEEAKDSTAKAMDSVATAAADTAITASVRAGLAADSELTNADVGVETREGRVVLRGVAPDGAARDRMTQIATAVKGVVAVDNQLTTAR